ncbi:MAG: hypothetical protein CL916_10310 [Deltaproteobacteria bacterium]|nr:hypothetical protein [Deltaproteobacteria bacterium]
MMFLLLNVVLASPGEMFLRFNIPQLARENAQAMLDKNPDNLAAHAQIAISLCRLGRYNDALPHFIFAQGTSLYPIRLHEYHADALRYTGKVEQAVDLRSELLMDSKIPVGMHPRILAGMVDDWRYAGKTQKAFDIAFRLMSKHPNAALSYAMMAQLYLDMADPQEAFFYIWRGRRKVQNTRTEEVYARYLLETGYPDLAEKHIRLFFENNVRNSLLALYAKVKLEAYGPKKALALLNRNKFKGNQSPRVLLIRAQSYDVLGKKDAAAELYAFLKQTYPSIFQKP